MALRTDFFITEAGSDIAYTLSINILSYLTQPEDMAHAMMACTLFNQAIRRANLHYVPNGFSRSQPFRSIPTPEFEGNLPHLTIINLNETIVILVPEHLYTVAPHTNRSIIVVDTNTGNKNRILVSKEVVNNIIKLDAEHFIVVSENYSPSSHSHVQNEIAFELWHVNHIGTDLNVTLKATQKFTTAHTYNEATGAFFDEKTIVFTQGKGPVTQWNIATNTLAPFVMLDKPYEPGYLVGRTLLERIEETTRKSKQVRFISNLDEYRIAICFAVTIKIWDKRINNFTHSGVMKVNAMQTILPHSDKVTKKQFNIYLLDENHLLYFDFNYLLLWNFGARLNTLMTQVTKIKISAEGEITNIYRISPNRIAVLASVDDNDMNCFFVFHYQDGKLRLQSKLVDRVEGDGMVRRYGFHVIGNKFAVGVEWLNYLNIYDLNDPALSFDRPPVQQLAYDDAERMNLPHGFLAQRKTHQLVTAHGGNRSVSFWRPNPLKASDQIRDQQGRVNATATSSSSTSSSTATLRSLGS